MLGMCEFCRYEDIELKPYSYFAGEEEVSVGNFCMVCRNSPNIEEVVSDVMYKYPSKVGYETLLVLRQTNWGINLLLSGLALISEKVVTKSFDNVNEFRKDLELYA